LDNRLPEARQTLDQAQQIDQKNPEVHLFVLASEGMLLYVAKQNQVARQMFVQCDSLIAYLSNRSNLPIQKKYARKLSLEVYQDAYELLNKLWLGNHSQFAQDKAWFTERVAIERARYQDLKVSASLQDSLAISRTTPRTYIVQEINPWWWAMMVAVLLVGGSLLYVRRERTLKAHTDFIKAIQHSPIQGFDRPRSKEIAMLTQIEARLNRPLRLKEIKILLLIGRGATYNKIFVDTGIPVGTVKSTVSKLTKKCKVENIRELM